MAVSGVVSAIGLFRFPDAAFCHFPLGLPVTSYLVLLVAA